MTFKKFKFKKVKSTNNTAIRIIKETKHNLGMVVAETQINGRGQYGRKWISSKGNLFISFFNELHRTKISINTITKINCLLVKKLLSSFTSKKILFKKPNDLLIDKKKISGILQEVITYNQKKYLIVGIGVNTNIVPKNKSFSSTCLKNIIDKKIDNKKILKNIKNNYEKFLIEIKKFSYKKLKKKMIN